MFVWWGAQTCALFFATLRSYILARLRSITFKHGNFLTFRCSFQRSWRVHDISWKNDAEGSFTCYIREVKHHVYVKRQTRICTTRPSFLSICRLLFNISTPNLVVSRNFSSIKTVLSCFYVLIFSILRNCHLESDVCHIREVTLYYLLRLYSDRFSTTIYAMQSHRPTVQLVLLTLICLCCSRSRSNPSFAVLLDDTSLYFWSI